MNTSRNTRRSNRKKAAIPIYFQKSHSNSQFLAAANYKLQIKKLKKTNKELARSLQEVKCRAADQERALAKCNQESTQAMFVKMKIKDIVETVQKLVTDLGNVYDVIDGKSFDFLRNSSATHQASRLQICNPSLSLVEESTSTIEADLSKEETWCDENLNRNLLPEIESAATTQEVSNENQSAAGRTSKSLEHTGASSPLELDATPQPPVFKLPIKRRSSVDLSKRGSITSQTPVKTADLPQMQPITSTSAVKSASKSTVSKIPVKKPAVSTEKNSPRLAVSSSDMIRRKTFTVGKIAEDSQAPLPVDDQTNKIVSNSLVDNATSGTVFDQRGTFVVDSLADNTKQDAVFDRRVTYFVPPESKEQPKTKQDVVLDRRGTYFVPSESKELPEAKLDSVLDRRGTYFVPAEPKEQHTSPATHNPVPNAVPNQTIYFCEDMELTEILPPQKQSPQLIPWNDKLEAKEPVLEEKLHASVKNQPLCTTLVEQFPISNINANIEASKQSEVGAIHGDDKDTQIQSTVNDNKSLSPNNLSKTKSLPEASVSCQDLNPKDPQQERYKEKNVEKKVLKEDTNVKRSAKELPSPITHYATHDMSIQHKIFESFSVIDAISNKNKPTFDSTSVIKDDNKELTVSKDSPSANQPAVEQMTEEAESPMNTRKSGRNKKSAPVYFNSSSDESNLDISIEFVPPKRLSIKPGRKIINPNNKKVFVFKTTSKKQSTNKDTLTDSSPNEHVEENIKSDQEKDVFNFSSSSDATKSPVMKNKKRKSLMPKGSKRSASKKSEGKKLSKTSRNSKPEVNNDEVSVAALPRKSILSIKKDRNSLKPFNRKSVAFSAIEAVPSDEINLFKSDSPSEENITSVNQKSDNISNVETMSSGSTQGSQDKKLSVKKRYSLARSNSLTPTGDILKSSSGKTRSSRKRQTNNLNTDSLENVSESDCSPNKKMCQVSIETAPKNTEAHTNLNRKKQDQNKDGKDRSKQSESPEVIEKNPTGKETEKSTALPNPYENIKDTRSTDKVEKADVKVKRPFSGISERRSNKKQSIVDDLFPAEVSEEKSSDGKEKKGSSRKFSKLSQNLKVNINNIVSADEGEKTDNKVKRPFSGVSERRSNKKISMVEDLFPSEVHEEKPTDRKEEKISTRILSELPLNSDAGVKNIGPEDEIEETKTNQAKRPYSGVSESTSNKKQSMVDDPFPFLNHAICEMDDMKTSFKLEDEPTEIYNVKAMIKSVETNCDKNTLENIKKVEHNKGSQKKKSSNKKKTSKQSNSKENIPSKAVKNVKLDVLSDYNLDALSNEFVGKVKPKNSRKKKESVPVFQPDLKVDDLNSENEADSEAAEGGRFRRRKQVNYKVPSLNCKMRRE